MFLRSTNFGKTFEFEKGELLRGKYWGGRVPVRHVTLTDYFKLFGKSDAEKTWTYPIVYSGIVGVQEKVKEEEEEDVEVFIALFQGLADADIGMFCNGLGHP